MDDRSRNIAIEASGEAVNTADAEAIFQSLSGHGRIDDPELLQDLRVRICRSLDDPRPSLSLDQVDASIDTLVAKARADSGRA